MSATIHAFPGRHRTIAYIGDVGDHGVVVGYHPGEQELCVTLLGPPEGWIDVKRYDLAASDYSTTEAMAVAKAVFATLEYLQYATECAAIPN
jgi:hypothetical protein